jgi:hypothetical protein
MKILTTVLTLILSGHLINGQPLTWDVNDATPRKNVQYENGIIITLSNHGTSQITLDSKVLCLKEGKLSIKLNETGKMVFGLCSDTSKNIIVEKSTVYQLKASNGSKLTLNIAFSTVSSVVDLETSIPTFSNTEPRPYYDALLLKNGKPEDILKICKKYNIGTDSVNPFLKGLLTGGTISRGTNKLKFIGSTIGGLDVTTFADGLAKFMVKRAKEELTITFFEKFKETLDNNKDMQTLFPLTSGTLGLIDKEIYNYEQYLATLRENFEGDFNTLPDNLTGIIENHYAFFSAKPELKAGIELGAKVASGLRDKDHPGKILASIDSTELLGFSSDSSKTMVQAFTLVQVLSESLREIDNKSDGPYWIDADKLATLNKDLQLRKYFIGLNLEMINMRNPDLYEILIDFGADVAKYKPLIQEISGNVKRINQLVANNKTSEKLSLETVSSYVNGVTGLFETTTKAIELLKPDEKVPAKLNKILPWVKQSNLLVSNISQEKYSSALFNLIEFYKLSLTGERVDSMSGSKWLVKYGTFMAAMISAENSDQVATIIETYALPSGSARIKKFSTFNVSINSYLGPYRNTRNFKKDVWKEGSWGITAPVGVALNWGTKTNRSNTAFFSLIDIGAITTFRFNNDSSEVAKIYLKEIIAPGIFYSRGFKKVPISFNMGGQFIPYLQKVGAASNDYGLNRNWRFSIALVVDIPLLNLYNKSRE